MKWQPANKTRQKKERKKEKRKDTSLMPTLVSSPYARIKTSGINDPIAIMSSQKNNDL